MSDSRVETIPVPFLSCSYCQRNVETGFLSVNVSLAKRRKLVRENYESGLTVPLPIPPLVVWEILHDRCAAKMRRGVQTGDEFRLDASAIHSTADLVILTSELMKKSWIQDTNLSSTLLRIMADTLFHYDEKAERKKRRDAKKNSEAIPEAV